MSECTTTPIRNLVLRNDESGWIQNERNTEVPTRHGQLHPSPAPINQPKKGGPPVGLFKRLYPKDKGNAHEPLFRRHRGAWLASVAACGQP